MVLIIIYIPVPVKQVPVLQPIPSHSTPLKQEAEMAKDAASRDEYICDDEAQDGCFFFKERERDCD